MGEAVLMDDEQQFYEPGDPDAPEDSGPDPADNKGRARDGAENVTPLRPGNGGTPLAERTEEEPEGQLDMFFVEEKGKKVTFADLKGRNVSMEVRYVLTGKSLPNTTGGLLDPFKTGHLIIADCVVDHVKPAYIRDADQVVEKVILYVSLKPRIVQQALSEAGQRMLQEAGLKVASAA